MTAFLDTNLIHAITLPCRESHLDCGGSGPSILSQKFIAYVPKCNRRSFDYAEKRFAQDDKSVGNEVRSGARLAALGQDDSFFGYQSHSCDHPAVPRISLGLRRFRSQYPESKVHRIRSEMQPQILRLR